MKYVFSLWMMVMAMGIVSCAPRVDPPARPEPPEREEEAEEEVSPRTVVMPALNGTGTIRLEEYAGNVVLLDFWATWCPPCIAELPDLKALYEEFRDQDFMMVGMTVDQGTKEQVREKVKPFDLPYPVGLADRSVQETFGGIRVVPTKFLLDRDGTIQRTYQGVRSIDELRADIRELL